MKLQMYQPMKARTFEGYELFKSENKPYKIYDSYNFGETRIEQSYENFVVKTMLKVEDITGRGKLQGWVMNPFTELVEKSGKLYLKDQKLSDAALVGNATKGFIKVYSDHKYHKSGDKVYYKFKITNTGNVTLNKVIINDAKLV